MNKKLDCFLLCWDSRGFFVCSVHDNMAIIKKYKRDFERCYPLSGINFKAVIHLFLWQYKERVKICVLFKRSVEELLLFLNIYIFKNKNRMNTQSTLLCTKHIIVKQKVFPKKKQQLFNSFMFLIF